MIDIYINCNQNLVRKWKQMLPFRVYYTLPIKKYELYYKFDLVRYLNLLIGFNKRMS